MPIGLELKTISVKDGAHSVKRGDIMLKINLVEDGIPLKSVSKGAFLMAHRVEEFGINELWIKAHPDTLTKQGYVIPEGLIPIVRIQDGVVRLDGQYYSAIPVKGKFVLDY